MTKLITCYYGRMSAEFDDLLGKDEEESIPAATAREMILKERFELQITNEAITAIEKGDFMKSSMLSWSYIEEFFLPTFINRLSRYHKLDISSSLIDKSNANTLINYYYLLSHDKELYDKLNNARRLRNKLVHSMYRSASVDKIESLAKESAEININIVMDDLWSREDGQVNIPSLMIAINARNELREEQRARIPKIINKYFGD